MTGRVDDLTGALFQLPAPCIPMMEVQAACLVS